MEQMKDGEEIKLKHTWVPFEKISKHLPMAVIASEDNKFATHNGFDFEAIQNQIFFDEIDEIIVQKFR